MRIRVTWLRSNIMKWGANNKENECEHCEHLRDEYILIWTQYNAKYDLDKQITTSWYTLTTV